MPKRFGWPFGHFFNDAQFFFDSVIFILNKLIRSTVMAVHEYTRSAGQRLAYTIMYDQGEYFIERDGKMKKSVPDAVVAGVAPDEAKASLMLRMAIADIESLNGMDE
jgi:hypothetical protein